MENKRDGASRGSQTLKHDQGQGKFVFLVQLTTNKMSAKRDDRYPTQSQLYAPLPFNIVGLLLRERSQNVIFFGSPGHKTVEKRRDVIFQTNKKRLLVGTTIQKKNGRGKRYSM